MSKIVSPEVMESLRAMEWEATVEDFETGEMIFNAPDSSSVGSLWYLASLNGDVEWAYCPVLPGLPWLTDDAFRLLNHAQKLQDRGAKFGEIPLAPYGRGA